MFYNSRYLVPQCFAGVDPTTSLQQFAGSKGLLPDRFHSVALGQGQGPIAIKLIQEFVCLLLDACLSLT